MHDSVAPRRIVLSPEARSDIREAARWGREWFGERAVRRYRVLVEQAFRDIAADPELAGSRARPEFAGGTRTYHLAFSRGRAWSELGIVKAPRHLVVYRPQSARAIVVVRVLHDSCELERHVE